MDVVDSTEASWVVVDAGNADFSLSWHGIQPEVAKFTRICTYDRAGCEWSDPFPEPRTAKAMADGDGNCAETVVLMRESHRQVPNFAIALENMTAV